ncbi:MAG: 4-(cytidine 5'-diphospho)-2-C-methyl-D-erythritol kinase [Chitinophagaceae bacterium]|nr:MAG: 4-(cytidine 5'-diphospho)-2-C-methyl-D-erythritol kinase [Chitinophagaceae bacterium]
MISFPNAKINIGLNILGKRADGYHNLQTIFYPIALKDALEIIEAPGQIEHVKFSSSGLTIQGKEEDNLCIKAYQLLKKDFAQLPSVAMHLHKVIPMGAGMGGGSADGAFALRLINSKFELGLSTIQLQAYALQLGSDCPFFILNKPCLATGRGEILQPIPFDLSAYRILIVHPGIHINTAAAFSQIDIAPNTITLQELINRPIASWKDDILNDFEKPAFREYPEIARIKAALYENGAVYSAMSGSGSTVYGLFDLDDQPPIDFPQHYFSQWV